MLIVLAHCGNGYSGCDSDEVFFYDNGTAEKEIDSEVWNWACENAESFSYVHFGWDESYTDEDYDDYIENYVTFGWHIATYEEYVEWCENYGYEPRAKEAL